MLEQTLDDVGTQFSAPLSGDAEAETNPNPQARYVVHLPVFEGPLDLLLHLIEKRQMEITTISLVAVTDQYLAYLQRWQELVEQPVQNQFLSHENEDPISGATARVAPTENAVAQMANMAAFVSIAARLLFIKSQSLLPHSAKEELTDEAQKAAVLAEELQRHLLEYKIAKEIAAQLRQREEAGLQTHGRSGLLAGIEAQLTWTPPTLVGLEVQALAAAFQRLLDLRARDEPSGADLMPLARVRVSERIAEIVSLLSEQSTMLLEEVLANETSRLVIIVTFLALLELWKHERITVTQEQLFGPIIIERGERWAEKGVEEEVIAEGYEE